MSHPQMDQQQLTDARKEEYLAAKRAATEAVEIGQATLAESVRQGEQLRNAEKTADHTQFALDKSARLLRGMTWSGWFANLVSKDVSEEDYFTKQQNQQQSLATQYENVPEKARDAAQAIQNYHANLQVFLMTETEEQRETCRIVCDNMYHKASTEISKLQRDSDLNEQDDKLLQDLSRDLSRLRDRQKSYQRDSRPKASPSGSDDSAPKGSPSVQQQPQQQTSSAEDALFREQEDHLGFLSRNLDEMHLIANSLHESVSQQHQVIDSLDEKSDAITDKTRMVTRRADRLIQKKTWTPAKKKLHGFVRIRHIATGLYIANENGALVLADKDKRHPQSCKYALWTRQGDIFGLKNEFSDKWMGQTMFGSLACTATKFGARDEWQADEDWQRTRLICCSAGWGSGGYLMAQQRDGTLLIGKSGPEAKKEADLWTIEELSDQEL